MGPLLAPQIFFQEIILFIGSLFLAVISASRMREGVVFESIAPAPPSVLGILLYVFLGTVVLLVLSRVFKKHKQGIFHFLFGAALLGGMEIFFLSIFGSTLVAFIISFTLTLYRLLKPNVLLHNFTVIFASSGAAAMLGIGLNVFNVVVLLAIISLYDVIAVYKTKHMIFLAKEMISAQTMFGFIIPENMYAWKTLLKEALPGQGFLFLGGGDIVFPALLAVSAFQISPVASWLVIFGSSVGLYANTYLFINQEKPKAIPALPLIALGAVFGLGLFYLLKIS